MYYLIEIKLPYANKYVAICTTRHHIDINFALKFKNLYGVRLKSVQTPEFSRANKDRDFKEELREVFGYNLTDQKRFNACSFKTLQRITLEHR